MDSSTELTLVYVLKPAQTNEQLRYSLRSIAAHLPCARVVVVGFKPSWVRGVEHVRVYQARDHRSNVPGLIHALVRAEVAGRWVLMNDDFFALTPSPPIESVYSTSLEGLGSKPGWRSGWYHHARVNTAKILTGEGVGAALSYDRVHRPMAFDNELLASALDRANTQTVLVRSLYGNLYSDGVAGEDAKARSFTSLVPSSGWVSTGRESWQGITGTTIRSRFKSPCCFEV